MSSRKFFIGIAVGFLPLVLAFGQDTRDVAFHYKVDPESVSILRRREIHVYVRGNRPDLTLTHIFLKPGVELEDFRRDAFDEIVTTKGSKTLSLPCKTSDGEAVGEAKEIHLGDGKTEIELIFSFSEGQFWSPCWNRRLNWIEPGLQDLEFQANIESESHGAAKTLKEPIHLSATAPALSVTLGGVLGAFGLALLRFVYRLREGSREVDWRAERREGLIAIVGGAIIAWALTFIGGILDSAKLGIEIAATSCKGGVIIGFFSYKIGDLLAQKLWGKNKPPKVSGPRRKRITPKNLDPVTKLPSWIPPITGFNPKGKPKYWIDDGKIEGIVTGSVTGTAKGIAKEWIETAKADFKTTVENIVTAGQDFTRVDLADLHNKGFRVMLTLNLAKSGNICSASCSYSEPVAANGDEKAGEPG